MTINFTNENNTVSDEINGDGEKHSILYTVPIGGKVKLEAKGQTDRDWFSYDPISRNALQSSVLFEVGKIYRFTITATFNGIMVDLL